MQLQLTQRHKATYTIVHFSFQKFLTEIQSREETHQTLFGVGVGISPFAGIILIRLSGVISAFFLFVMFRQAQHDKKQKKHPGNSDG